MSRTFQNTRISELLLDLVCMLDPNHGHDHLARTVKMYAAAVQNHKYLSVMERDVEASFSGICEKIAISSRVKESHVLKLSKDAFIQRYAVARDCCIASDFTEGSGIPIAHAMLKLMMCLAYTPTAIGKHIPIQDLMEAERLLSQPTLPLSALEDAVEDDEISDNKVLKYSEWLAQCAEEDSEDEQDESWLGDVDPPKPKVFLPQPRTLRVAQDSATTDSESGIDMLDDDGGTHSMDYEYLKYGSHISQYDSTTDIRDTLELCSTHRSCTHIPYLNSEQALVLGHADVCRMVLQSLSGFQNDLFMLNSEGIKPDLMESRAWVRSTTASRGCLPGTTVASTQQLLEWFLGLADDAYFCRTVAGAAMHASAQPKNDQRSRRLGHITSGHVLLSADGCVVTDPCICIAVLSDAIIPLYTAVHQECEEFSACTARLEKRVAGAGSLSSQDLDTGTLLTMYIAMLPWKRLFSCMRGMISSTKTIYFHCRAEWERDEMDNATASEKKDTSLERSVLSTLVRHLVADINRVWFCCVASCRGPGAHHFPQLPVLNDGDSSDSECSTHCREDSLRLPPEDIGDIEGANTMKDMCYLFSVCVLVELLRSEMMLMVSSHALMKNSSVDSTGVENTSGMTKYIFEGSIQRLWEAARESCMEFELVARIPGVLGCSRADSELRGEGAVTSIFRDIGDLACEAVAVMLGASAGSMLPQQNPFGARARKLTTPRLDCTSPAHPGHKRHTLFQNTTESISVALQVPMSFLLSDGGGYYHEELRVNDGLPAYQSIFSVLSGASVLRAVAMGPLLAAIRWTSSAAAGAMVQVPRPLPPSTDRCGFSEAQWSQGFRLLHHLEYLRMLYLMGGETIREVSGSQAGSSTNDDDIAWINSPAVVLVSMQETYTALLEEIVLQQHNTIDVFGKSGTVQRTLSQAGDNGKNLFTAFSQQLYGLSQLMLSQVMGSLPPQNSHKSTSSAGSEGLLTGIGVAVSFRAIPPRNPPDQPPDTSPQISPVSIWPSAALSNLFCQHLSIEVYYPFPLNRVLTPVLVRRLHCAFIQLLRITTMRWAVDSTWKLDRVSKGAFEHVLVGYKNADDVSLMKRSLDRCRVSMSLLMHTMKGLVYYFMSEIHDTAWERLCVDMKVASHHSMHAQAKLVAMYVQRIEGLLALYESYLSDILDTGHAAVSSYQLALYAVNDVCLCAKEDAIHTAGTLGSTKAPVVVARCVAAIKRTDLQFAAMRRSVCAFLDVLSTLGGDGSEGKSGGRSWSVGMASIVNAAGKMVGSVGGFAQREASWVLSVNETRKLGAILGMGTSLLYNYK